MQNRVKKTKTNTHLQWFGVILIMGIAVVAAFVMLLYQKKIVINPYFSSHYEVCGVDISRYQGDVDWEVLSAQIDFAYIKATEGSLHVDDCYKENVEEAQETQIPIGAYHFFSFESSGESQASNYIATVGRFDGMLTPVIDVEYYASDRDRASTETIQRELHSMLDSLEAYYGCKPMIYATMTSYTSLIQGEFKDYPIWIRNVYYPPLFIANDWTIWQYSDKGMLKGYHGEEIYIDMNVFHGNREELSSLRVPYNSN